VDEADRRRDSRARSGGRFVAGSTHTGSHGRSDTNSADSSTHTISHEWPDKFPVFCANYGTNVCADNGTNLCANDGTNLCLIPLTTNRGFAETKPIH
jgi:hypothetical protein